MNQEHINGLKKKEIELKKIQTKLDRIEERFVFEEISKDQYDKFKSKLESEKHEIEKQIGKNDFKSSNLEKSIDPALQYSLNLPLLWELGNIQTKRAIQFMVFPDGIMYDFKNDTFRTLRVNEIFDSIGLLSNDYDEKKKKKESTL